jgi:hypothetical protein
MVVVEDVRNYASFLAIDSFGFENERVGRCAAERDYNARQSQDQKVQPLHKFFNLI